MGKPAPVSPFAPASLPDVPEVAGVRFATAEAGIRYKGRTDLLLAVLAPGTEVAGVLTRSKTRSAPVDWCAIGLREGKARALVVNSGNANAFTGKKGLETVVITADAAAAAVGCAPGEVFIASTGRHRRAARRRQVRASARQARRRVQAQTPGTLPRAP